MGNLLSLTSSKLEHVSVAVGKFDGCHLAHQQLAGKLRYPGCALSILTPNPPYITPPYLREELLGVPMFFLQFGLIRELDSVSFLKGLCSMMPNVQKIVVGYDFCLGRGRMNNASDLPELLSRACKSYMEVEVLPRQEISGIPIHTTTIRECIAAGDLTMANRMLGRLYHIEGRSIRGQGIGSRMLVPTINVEVDEFVLPLDGVYASKTDIQGARYNSVSFVGHRHATDGRFCIETHILERFKDRVNPKTAIKIHFVKKIRDSMAMSIDTLEKQIREDVMNAKITLQQLKEKQ